LHGTILRSAAGFTGRCGAARTPETSIHSCSLARRATCVSSTPRHVLSFHFCVLSLEQPEASLPRAPRRPVPDENEALLAQVLARVSENLFRELARARNAAQMRVLTDPSRDLGWGSLDLGLMPDARALRYYQNGHLLHLELGKHPDAGLLYVRGTVYASMKSQSYQCIVTLSPGQQALQLPQCSCAAGWDALA